MNVSGLIFFPSRAKETKNNSNNNNAWSQVKGTGSRFSACLLTKVLFFCRKMLYRLCKQYDHVIMNCCQITNLHTPHTGSHLINLGANSCKLIKHGIKPLGQQFIQRWQCWRNRLIFLRFQYSSSPLQVTVKFIHFYFEIHSEIAEVHVSGITN